MEETDKQALFGNGGAEGPVEDHSSHQFEAQGNGHDAADDRHGAQTGRFQVVAPDDPMTYQGYTPPRPRQVDRAEGDDPKPSGLDQKQDHDLAQIAVGRSIDGDESGYADRGGGCKQSVDQRQWMGSAPGDW